MGKSLYIAEKPSVAQEFAKALHINTKRKDGYLESEETIVTWCVGHLVTMSYPEEYDPALKRWSLETLPFIPQEFKYEVIPAVAKQFRIVSGLLNREDVDTIYVCTDSGREGEYIYRLVEQQAGVKGKNRRRVWIDSQTEEEILRGIKEAKNLNEYDNLAGIRILKSERRLSDGNQFFQTSDFKIRQQYIQLSEYEIFCRIGRTCDDLCPWHGRAKRTGDPRVRRDAVLQSVKYNWRERFDVRGRMESGQRFKVVRIF